MQIAPLTKLKALSNFNQGEGAMYLWDNWQGSYIRKTELTNMQPE